MEKKLTLTEYVLALGFIFMLALALGAFFFGYHLGSEKTETRFMAVLEKERAEKGELNEYHQQYLVSFYHTIYSPYLEFHKKWFDHLHTIELQPQSVEPATLLKELELLAEQKYEEIKTKTTPLNSPLLGEAHKNYLNGLKMFHDALKRLRGTGAGQTGRALAEKINSDSDIRQAQHYALQGQKSYYHAMIRWHSNVDPQVEEQFASAQKQMDAQTWKGLHLTVKNGYMASLMEQHNIFRPFLPQDLTIRVDEMSAADTMRQLGARDIDELAQLLISTNAVRADDFQKNKQLFYRGEVLPQLPFFLE